ncbi:MAG: recombination mediator RecR [Actinobacteria bacterium]|nr:recombination mediator RecR [Actinomycetota bacterium]MCL6094280.1 recombination mediator RecR [Actinomycetota bacterium]
MEGTESSSYAAPVRTLIEEFTKFPGVGQKSAQRMAFFILNAPKEDAVRLANAIVDLKERMRLCERCFNVADSELCPICSDPQRDHSVICVVEDPRDVAALERSKDFHGTYHVLHGSIRPIDGVGPEQLKVRELIARINEGGIEEVILCTNLNIEGEATAMYLAQIVKPLGVKVTRIASGVPVGSDLEYADELTLSYALAGRREIAT